MTSRVPRASIAIYESREDAAAHVAEHLVHLVERRNVKVLGVATGSSPSSVHAAMAERGRNVFSQLTLFALDEYVGLPVGHPERYRAVIEREVAAPLGIPVEHVHLPDPGHPDAYEPAIRAVGGVDLQLLGIGRNAHIGFNEPGSAFASRTRVVQLDESTRAANARFFDSIDEVPHQAVTQGIGTILEAQRLVVLAFGADKRDAVEAALLGNVNETVPATALRGHADVTWILDRDAAGVLSSRP
jgi:glucosamine-6-phosphate deaminase